MSRSNGSSNDIINENSGILKLLNTMEQLRSPTDGCEWDLSQTFESLIKYIIEEAYEVIAAIRNSDMSGLKEELGDLLFQVVFISRIAEEKNIFTFNEVANHISEKMVKRHPHVFSGQTPPSSEKTHENKWEDTKELERRIKASSSDKDLSALDDVPDVFPALIRAEKLQKRASRIGFDWPDWFGAYQKVNEELMEVYNAIMHMENQTLSDGPNPSRSTKIGNNKSAYQDSLQEELGDLLFSCVNLARKLNSNSETLLQDANLKFENRFRKLEHIVKKKNKEIKELSDDELNEIWLKVKKHSD